LIESYRFGTITIDGERYHKDRILLSDQIIEDWWRDEGHKVGISDLEAVIKFKSEILIIGKGSLGLVKVSAEAEKILQNEGIELIAVKTGRVKELYNKLRGKGMRVAAALHLTC
jgi:hypothetical protein